jgi:hypothetical protein
LPAFTAVGSYVGIEQVHGLQDDAEGSGVDHVDDGDKETGPEPRRASGSEEAMMV